MARTQQDELVGVVAADVSDKIDLYIGAGSRGLAKSLLPDNTDFKRFMPVGISLYGTDSYSVSVLVADTKHSNKLLSICVKDDFSDLTSLFKRLSIDLYDADKKEEFEPLFDQQKYEELDLKTFDSYLTES